MSDAITAEIIAARILELRGKKVMIDRDLAKLYGVKVKRLNEQVKRNMKRFPDASMFQVTKEEGDSLRSHFAASNSRSQFVTSKRGGRRYPPYVFTQEGVAMLSSVLNSERTISVNIYSLRNSRDKLVRREDVKSGLREEV